MRYRNPFGQDTRPLLLRKSGASSVLPTSEKEALVALDSLVIELKRDIWYESELSSVSVLVIEPNLDI
jgi:hypothetical protein